MLLCWTLLYSSSSSAMSSKLLLRFSFVFTHNTCWVLNIPRRIPRKIPRRITWHSSRNCDPPSLDFLTTELCKSLNHINREIMWIFFQIRMYKFELRSKVLLDVSLTYTVKHGIKSVRFRARLLQNFVPTEIMLWEKLEIFETAIKFWKDEKYIFAKYVKYDGLYY